MCARPFVCIWPRWPKGSGFHTVARCGTSRSRDDLDQQPEIYSSKFVPECAVESSMEVHPLFPRRITHWVRRRSIPIVEAV